MKKNALEIYNNIVNAKIGENISTRAKNGINYQQTIEDALRQQGYIWKKDFDTGYDYRTHTSYIKKLTDIKPYAEPKHDIKVGDIFYNSWGYDQTNIDYYQVVAVTAKTISIRRIKAGTVDYDAHMMTGHSKAIKDAFKSDEVLKKTPYLMGGQWRVNFEFGAGAKWDGSPMAFSCYA